MLATTEQAKQDVAKPPHCGSGAASSNTGAQTAGSKIFPGTWNIELAVPVYHPCEALFATDVMRTLLAEPSVDLRPRCVWPNCAKHAKEEKRNEGSGTAGIRICSSAPPRSMPH